MLPLTMVRGAGVNGIGLPDGIADLVGVGSQTMGWERLVTGVVRIGGSSGSPRPATCPDRGGDGLQPRPAMGSSPRLADPGAVIAGVRDRTGGTGFTIGKGVQFLCKRLRPGEIAEDVPASGVASIEAFPSGGLIGIRSDAGGSATMVST